MNPESSERPDRIDSLERTILERLNELERRLNLSEESRDNRVAHLMREKTALQAAQEEAIHHARQESLKEIRELEGRLNEKVSQIHQTLHSLAQRREEEKSDFTRLEDRLRRLQEFLTQTPKAKDQLIQDLEQEKLDLLHALQERTNQLRTNALERRDVEASLGQTLLELNRQAESDRSRRIEIERLLDRRQAGDDDAKISLEAQKALARSLEAQRDEALKASSELGRKLEEIIQERTKNDSSWLERTEDLQKALDQERQTRLGAQEQNSALQSQLRALNEQLARASDELQSATHESSSWKEEQESLLAALRKKEEMLSMLSATFQNMLRK